MPLALPAGIQKNRRVAFRPRAKRNYMTAILKLVVACVVLCLVPPAQAELTLYASGGSGLYTIDPATGAATLACDFNAIDVHNGGLAYDAATDTMYATGVLQSDTGTSRLFIVNRFTGAWTAFPGMSPTINLSSGGLAINPLTGIMYATGGNGFQSSALFTIDKNTGAATLVGLCGGQCCVSPFGFNINGLGFRSDGTLFANGFTLSGIPVNGAYSLLFTLDLASGLATEVGPHGVNVGRQLNYSGLAFGTNGTLYSLGSTSASAQGLYVVNPANGAATVIGDTVIHFGVDGGLAFAPGPVLTIIGVSLSGTNLVLNGSNGLSGRTYQVLASTNVALPVSQWLPVATNVLNTSGNFTITATNVVNPSFPQRFYMLRLQ
jgi:hypothetical protein